MNHLIIDSHIHLDRYTKQDRDGLLQELKGSALITVSCDLESAKTNMVLSRMNNRIKPAVGAIIRSNRYRQHQQWIPYGLSYWIIKRR